MRPRRHLDRFERGQTLVLFAVSMLLIMLMVMMTLSFSTKAKEKMEVQQVADQAAYSNAIVTARTFNMVALTNRVMIAHMVSIAGIQAALSYAGLYRGFLNAVQMIYMTLLMANSAGCAATIGACSCCCRGVLDYIEKITVLGKEVGRVQLVWEIWDTLSALEAFSYQASALAVSAFQMKGFEQMKSSLRNNQVIKDIVRHASGGNSEWQVPSGANDINLREVGDITGPAFGVLGAAIQANSAILNRPSVFAAMASRGNPWVAGRFLEGGRMQLALFMAIMPGNQSGNLDVPIIFTPSIAMGQGSAYFGPILHSNNLLLASDTSVWADDHGAGLLLTSGGCLRLLPAPMTALSGASAGLFPIHAWIGNGIPGTDLGPRHFLLPSSLPGVWPVYIDYNPIKVALDNDAFGQPKNFAVVQRDYRNRPLGADPWNLFFRFRLSGTGETYSQGDVGAPSAIKLHDGTDISLQTALSTGITYYHRYGRWAEPPNLFNPFWRAGLSRANIDPKPTGGFGHEWYEDVSDALNNSGVPWAADAIRPLDTAGFQGVQ